MTADSENRDSVLKLDNYWPYQVTVLADRIARRTSKIVKERGLNLSQWRVMAAIAEVPGRTSVEVVTITPMDKGIVSRATRALLEMDLIRRQASQSDGRISHLYLTDIGFKLYRDLIPEVEDVLSRSNLSLKPDEREHLCQYLGALIKVIPDFR